MHGRRRDRPWLDAQPIFAVLHGLPESFELLHGRQQAIGLLDANVGDVADGRLTVEHGRDRRECHHGVGNIVHVDRDALQVARAGHGAARLVLFDARAELRQHVQEAIVALQGVHAQAGYGDATAAGGRERERVARRGSVGLDLIGTRDVFRRRDAKAVRRFFDATAEVGDHAAGDVDVGSAHERARDLDADRAFGEHRGHQQRRKILTRAIAAHAERATRQSPTVNGQGRAAGLAVDAHAQLEQAIDQVLNRATRHRFITHQGDSARHQAGERCQKAHGGAAIADEQRFLGRSELGPPTAHAQRRGAQISDRDAHGGQGVAHVACIVAVQYAFQRALALGQRGHHQGSVGDALRAGHVPGELGGSRKSGDGQRAGGNHVPGVVAKELEGR